jgi:hypothetical protein
MLVHMNTPLTGSSVSDLGPALQGFCTYLFSDRNVPLNRAWAIGNGFEGWLKFELCFWLIDEYDLKAGVDVGVESKVRVEMKDGIEARKQVDVWIRANGVDCWHYVELKAIFNNQNQGKVATGALHDLQSLEHIARDENVIQRAILVFGIGFSEEKEWQGPVERICEGIDDRRRPDWNHSMPPDERVRAAMWLGTAAKP